MKKKCYECRGKREWGRPNADGKMNGPCINCGLEPEEPLVKSSDVAAKSRKVTFICAEGLSPKQLDTLQDQVDAMDTVFTNFPVHAFTVELAEGAALVVGKPKKGKKRE